MKVFTRKFPLETIVRLNVLYNFCQFLFCFTTFQSFELKTVIECFAFRTLRKGQVFKTVKIPTNAKVDGILAISFDYKVRSFKGNSHDQNYTRLSELRMYMVYDVSLKRTRVRF